MFVKVLSSETVPTKAQKAKGGYTSKVKGADDQRTYSAQMLPGFEKGYLDNPSLVLAGEWTGIFCQ